METLYIISAFLGAVLIYLYSLQKQITKKDVSIIILIFAFIFYLANNQTLFLLSVGIFCLCYMTNILDNLPIFEKFTPDTKIKVVRDYQDEDDDFSEDDDEHEQEPKNQQEMPTETETNDEITISSDIVLDDVFKDRNEDVTKHDKSPDEIIKEMRSELEQIKEKS